MRSYARQLLNGAKDRYAFSRLPSIPCDTTALAPTRDFDVSGMLGRTHEEWDQARRDIEALRITSAAGGVNAGDRRALYWLIKYLQPRSVLELGSHIGASTVHIARALKELQAENEHAAYRLTTVDVMDVNDAVAKPWRRFGSTYSPAEMLRRLDCERLVTFRVGDSLDYLAACDETFDLIFVDDDHDAAHVYQELPLVLKLLNPKSYVLLHDYFPDNKPLWPDRIVVHGPWLAIQRLVDEGAALEVAPLGALPWPTKQGSHVTSLAVLGSA